MSDKSSRAAVLHSPPSESNLSLRDQSNVSLTAGKIMAHEARTTSGSIPSNNENSAANHGLARSSSNASSVGLDPNFDAEAARLQMDLLYESEKAKRATLQNLTGSRDQELARLLRVMEKLMDKRSVLKKKERILSSQAGQLLKGLKTEEVRVNKLSTVVTRIHKQRKHELSKISEPSWAVPHHYHMTAIEHSSGHSQPHVMDVGSMIRGHLRIYAMANSTVRFQRNATHVLGKAKSSRLRVSEQIKKVYRELRSTRAYIKEYEKMLDVVRPKLVDSKISYLKTLAVDEALLQSSSAEVKSSLTVETNRDLPGSGGSDDEEEKVPSPIRPSAMSPTSTAPFAEEVAIRSDLHRYEGDRRKKPRPPSLAPPREMKREQIQQPSTPRPNREGYRNIKMRFFQALNLSPPVLKESQEEEKGETPNKSSSVTRASPSPAASADNVQQTVIKDDWALLKRCFEELDPLDKAKQAAWEELESVLDKRERIVYALHKHGAATQEEEAASSAPAATDATSSGPSSPSQNASATSNTGHGDSGVSPSKVNVARD